MENINEIIHRAVVDALKAIIVPAEEDGNDSIKIQHVRLFIEEQHEAFENEETPYNHG